MDFKNSVIAFALTSESNLSFDIGNIQMIPFSTDASPVLNCTNDSETLTGLTSDVYRRWKGQDGGFVRTGWGNNPSVTHPAELHFPSEGGIGATYKNDGYGENGGLILNIKADEKQRDISRYIETGTLSFNIKVARFGSHSGEMSVHMGSGSSEESHSATYLIKGLAEGEEKTVHIPLKSFFMTESGAIDITSIQTINRPVMIQQP
ncbi:hypothetical protein [Endozoicomonas lisbonensis]|uniref:Phage tail protein n=1 Tax=Endozoicomonas lisbonensis TaxID=3120522 RepID=A0ABV2SJ97_9GAMM